MDTRAFLPSTIRGIVYGRRRAGPNGLHRHLGDGHYRGMTGMFFSIHAARFSMQRKEKRCAGIRQFPGRKGNEIALGLLTTCYAAVTM